jgi:membrane glycosyltransferase
MSTQLTPVLTPLLHRESDWRRTGTLRRWVIAMLVFGQTFAATWALLGVLPWRGGTWLEKAIVAVFFLLFTWISSGFWVALFGFAIRRVGGDALAPSARLETQSQPLARTAIIVPIFHEDVERTFAGIRSTWRDLQRVNAAEGFELFILSDSRNPEHWLREREAWEALRHELGRPPIHYRRRKLNLNRKTGNISDFLRRWGRRFRYAVVLDADSVMSGPTLAHLVRLMEASPRTGILQTRPRLINAASPHARVQQFSSALYGPLFTEGLAALQLGEASFWGHNAIIRVDAFMKHCALRRLRGRGFLGGSVLSHDFVEAAFMRKAGYEVWLEPSLDGSYEEPPPTLMDELARDQRWAHGNLQHLAFLFRRHFAFAHRLSFANGIMAYVSAALWFGYLMLLTAELARFKLFPIEYFPEPGNPFPAWPQWQPEWAVRLMVSTVFLLFAPKFLALIDLALDPVRARAMGGLPRVMLGVLIESIVSILLAPVRMVSHTWSVLTTLFNLEVRWAGQNRTQEYGWRQAMRHHLPGSLFALAWGAFAFWLQPSFLLWALPVAVPLLLAGPISVWLGRFRVGRRWRELGLLTTPEERSPPRVVAELQSAPPREETSGLSAFTAAVLHPRKNRLHVALARRRGNTPARREKRQALVERCLISGPQALTSSEQVWLLEDGPGLSTLHRQAWLSDTSSPWATWIAALCQGGAR